MAHNPHHRTTPLPHPSAQVNVRDQYSRATPGYLRDHPRSPPFPGNNLRHRSQMSPTTSPITGFSTTNRMGSNQFGGNRSSSANSIPPLLSIHTLGSLTYSDGSQTPCKVEINGSIDKGFFLAENEWTCYRRNYFSCVCSYTLTPHYPTTPVTFTPTNSNQTYTLYGFAMCISAVVSDNDSHTIELVQHTPKRDKGPIMKPEKARLSAKTPHNGHGHHLSMFGEVGTTRSVFNDGFTPQPNGQSLPSEHTYERIQFKQATQNNGKRRAAQQYYQLIVELWGDTGNHGTDQYVKVAYKKSAKMIVRGRSPGHYQNDRRGSHSSGPGGNAGALGHYTHNPLGGVNEFGAATILPTASYASYEQQPRGGTVYSVRSHHVPHETMIPPLEAKVIETAKDYQYFPAPLYEGPSTDRIDMYDQRSEPEIVSVPHMTSGMDLSGKVKGEYDGASLPPIFQSPFGADRRPTAFESRSTSHGCYPTTVPPTNMTMS